MKKFTTFALALISTLAAGLPGHAGSWQLDHYDVVYDAEQQSHYYTHETDPMTYEDNIINQKDTVTRKKEDSLMGGTYPIAKSLTANQLPAVSGSLKYSGRRYLQHPEFQMKAGVSYAQMTVTPYFKWQPSTTGEEPAPEFWIIENGFASNTYSHSYWGTTYTQQNRYTGYCFNPDSLNVGLDIPFNTTAPVIQSDYPGQDLMVYRTARHYVTYATTMRLTADGRTKVPGPTRTLWAQVSSPGWKVTELGADHYGSDPVASATPYVQYHAGVARFSLDVTTNEYARLQPDHPRNHWIGAYANPARTTPTEAGPAGKFYWNGGASYNANMSPELAGNMGNVTYNWMERGSKSVYLVPPDASQQPTDNQKPETSTQTKNFGHRMTEFAHGDTVQWTAEDPWNDAEPHHSKVTVAIQSDKPEKPILKAKTHIYWKRNPSTQYEAKVTYEAIDLDTGEVIPLSASGLNSEIASLMDSNPNDLPEVQQLDNYATQLNAVKKETFETGCFLVKGALEAEMMVASWFVPDETDLIVPGLGKAFKAKKMGLLFGKLINGVKRLNHGTIDAAKKITNRQNIIVRANVEMTNIGKVGQLSNKDFYSDWDQVGIQMKKRCLFGSACFTKGTLVAMSNGTFKPIEQIRVGDSVFSKDEATGEIAAKPVTQTFVRQSPTILKLTLQNDDVIETTKEHPFYVDGQGFQPAGLLAIGNSIVTRAGPKIAIKGIECRPEEQTVFNFTVADFHTYFVGKSAVWVHNISCADIVKMYDKAKDLADLIRGQEKGGKTTPKTVNVILLANGHIEAGYSRKDDYTTVNWGIHPDVAAMYLVHSLPGDTAPSPNTQRGNCAEAMTLSLMRNGYSSTQAFKQALKGGYSLSLEVIPVGKSLDHQWKHARPVVACGYCEDVLGDAEIVDIVASYNEVLMTILEALGYNFRAW